MKLNKYSLGIGDRFARQKKYQLKAFIDAKVEGIDVTPIWNKSDREHKTVSSDPSSVLIAATTAVKELDYKKDYFIDADHITSLTVDNYISSANFFTIDVADTIGKESTSKEKDSFLIFIDSFKKKIEIPGIEEELFPTTTQIDHIIDNYLLAAKTAADIHSTIASKKDGEKFLVEVSMDEVEKEQKPMELFFILAALAFYKVPINTIAPKFSGRFNKGVDYVGELDSFTEEFEKDILIIKYAISEFGLPDDLKLSVHTGSDKFSLYPIINKLIRKHQVGVHLKTAGTTWLEEVIGLSEAGGDALNFVKMIYSEAYSRFDELTAPYKNVLNVNKNELPLPEEIKKWSSSEMVQSLRHDKENPHYNLNIRQLMHVAYKIAAENKSEFLAFLDENEEIIGKNVYENIYNRHLKPLFKS